MIIGGVAGALVVLLFVSVSIRIRVMSASPGFRNRGAETLSPFMTVLLVAVLLAIPDQRRWEFGVELPCSRRRWDRGRLAGPASEREPERPADLRRAGGREPADDLDGPACCSSRGRRSRPRRGPVRDRSDDRRRGERLAVPDEDHRTMTRPPPV